MSTTTIGASVGAAGFGVGGDALTQDAWIVSGRDGVSGSAHLKLPPKPQESCGWLCAVGDGVGGPGLGSLGASAWVLATAALQREHPDLWASLSDWVLAAHAQMRQYMREHEAPLLGASLAVAWIRGRELSWVNVGATTLVLSRGGKLSRFAPAQTRGEMARRQGIPEPSAPDVPAQVLLLGRRSFTGDDALLLESGMDFGTMPVRSGDRLLLGTGSVALLDNRSLGRPFVSAGDPRAAAELISRRAREEMPGKDATSLVIHIGAAS